MTITPASDSHLREFISRQKFPLDDFQLQGCQAIEDDRGVLVCAPTGAGKTIVGEFAVSLALSRGTKCFYTTPIKALSNQKFHDLVEVHGEEAIGLLTGDVSINHDADVLVMTTEVLRNMIYARSEALTRLTHVVMDEIHFLSDKSRGAVWEEAILGLDESVSVVGLSATVSNSEEFGRWLETVRGDTEVIVSEHRPVPLNQWMMVGRRIHPLFEPDSGGEVNAWLEDHIDRLEGNEAIDRGRAQFKAGGFRARSSGESHSSRSGRPRQDRYRPLGRPEVLDVLQSQDMLPAITFIFSRAGCEGALYQCMRSSIVLTDQQEAEEIARIVDAGVAGIPEEDLKVLDFRKWRSALMRGFAAHHAGMLPAFRHIVEELFTKGLVRAVFATETLALGINMPARTVVLEKLVKYNGEAHVDLTPGQYTQLTGRAGRRGIDISGNAVVQWAPAMDPRSVAGLASTRTYPLISTFSPGYNMSVNLLKTIGFTPAHRLLEKSFAQFQADGSVVDVVRNIERSEARVKKLETQLSSHIPEEDIEKFLEYIDLRRELTDEERRAKRHSFEQREIEVARILASLNLGDVIAMPGKKRPLLAVVVQPSNNSSDPKPWVTMESGWSGRVDTAAFPMPPVVVGHMKLSRATIAQPRKNSKYVVRQFEKLSYSRPKRLKAQQRNRPTEKITELRARIRSHPAHQWDNREDLARIGEKLARAQKETSRLRTTVETATDTLGKTFDRILGLLGELNYVEFIDGVPKVTEEGENLAKIHNESDLLVAQCLKRGIWDGLDPAELAGVVSMCTFENRKETRGEPEAATEPMAAAMNNTLRLWDELSVNERRYQLPVTKYPEAGFSLAVHQWTAGAPLGYCLAAAAESGAELTAGDFVRQCRQVIDLLEQIRSTAYSNETKKSARSAIEAIRRGVVAIGN
ncbi:DEAD/DEAH box helicase [Corynebacterium silvaticum]|uniref:DEAD/DEAH box helicase n=1 Tax=Corynebacterium silvaticum TaxID=2320431 RepID=A0A7Y4LGF5_9CORY|nr:DEAD/DEAH box helicase [Corynebacterium silvaticum]ARU46145.1 DEAD/DEAH box helicase [Corynebacterium silvaticum]MBH5299255.1 DEAD/DEAH box helicase [Corynebacterium silvaticum]NOM64425.1 DEAD/DEAH box helicase [Corynebacterium silvaticum]NON69634.1 DEAD/DEAH box helicase [Corynebacterium silvaticum]TFA94251.1 DEAD/DEAH box helicase [Corynebacterium silvaticum]